MVLQIPAERTAFVWPGGYLPHLRKSVAGLPDWKDHHRCTPIWTFGTSLLLLAITASTGETSETRQPEPGWLPVVIATGPLRTQIDATPIEQRPYRPLHFYGNTIRRVYYRGTPLPRVGEMAALPFRTAGVGSRARREEFTTGKLIVNRRPSVNR